MNRWWKIVVVAVVLIVGAGAISFWYIRGRPMLKRVCEVSDANLTSMAEFSPSEATLAVITGDGAVKILDTSGKPVRTLKRKNEQIAALAYSPDGKRLMTGTRSGKVLIWDLHAGTSRVVFEKPGVEAARVAWLGDTGQGVLGVSVDQEKFKGKPSAFVFTLANGKVTREFSSWVRDDFQTLATSPDGRHVALLDMPDKPQAAFLLDAEQGALTAMLFHAGHASGPLSVAIAPDNSTVAAGYAPWDVILWDAQHESVLKVLEGHENWVVSLGFSPDMKMLVSGAGDSTARVWSVSEGKELGRIQFPGPSTYVKSVGFSHDGKLILAAAENGQVVIAQAPKLP
jgi:WD40 repeat protein